MLRSSYDSANLFPFLDFDDIASPSACLDDANPTVVPAMRHALVDARVDSYHDFLARVEGSEQAAEADFSSRSRRLVKESSSP